jgi:hypothetical protein
MFVAIFAAFVFVVVSVSLLPVSEEVRYASLRDDAARLRWVHERIVRSREPIDVAFIGTSHTLMGVDDRSIQRQLALAGKRVNVVNLGVIWAGRDLHLLITRELLLHKKPKIVIIEINEHEAPYGHPLVPYVGGISDLLCCRFYLDFHFPQSLFAFLHRQLINVSNAHWSQSKEQVRLRSEEFGGMMIEGTSTEGELARSLTWGDRTRIMGYALTASYGLNVVEMIVKEIEASGSKAAFLYLPEYKYARMSPIFDIDCYRKLGLVIFPPAKILAYQDNYFDDGHLNMNGAQALIGPLTTVLSDTLLLEDGH